MSLVVRLIRVLDEPAAVPTVVAAAKHGALAELRGDVGVYDGDHVRAADGASFVLHGALRAVPAEVGRTYTR